MGDVFKDLLFRAYLLCGWVQLRDLVLSLLGRSRAVVLYYHRVGGRNVLTKPIDEFRDELTYIKKRYECVSLAELCRRAESGRPFRRRMAVVTFDDGYRDNFTNSVPVLNEAGIPATFFVSTGFIGTDREFPHDAGGSNLVPHSKLTWDDLRAMEAAGHEIGSHTVNHTNLGRSDAVTMESEVRDSLTALNHELERRPRPFSFPWGKPDDMPRQALEVVRSAGYYCSVSAFGGSNTTGADPFEIRRVDVGNGNLSRLAVRARIAGLDPDYLRLKLSR